LAQIANKTHAKSHVALRSSGLLQTDFGATNIASSLGRSRSNQAFSRLPTILMVWSGVEMPEPRYQRRLHYAAPPPQLRNPGASRPVRATYSV
jgi:hypothetical protein